MSAIDNPYIGLRTYTEEQKNSFWGREDDINRLANAIIENYSTLIYGCSGCGKSSLINAGLIPALREYKKDSSTYNYLPITISPKTCWNEEDDCLRLWHSINNAIDNYAIKHNLIKAYQITGKELEDKDLACMSLWEKLNIVKYKDEHDNPVNFFIIIDQFEEIFQLKLNLKDIHKIFCTYELMCGYYKLSSIEKINDPSIADLDKIKKFAYKKPENNHRFVVTIRQDFLYELETHAASYPILYKNRIHINSLNEEQAFRVITSSKKDDGTPLFTKHQAIGFIRDLTGREDFKIDGYPEIKVDPMMLSLYLQELCNCNDNRNSSAENIIQDFYFKNMNIRGIEELEASLLSSDGRYRKSIPVEDAERAISDTVVDRLDRIGILIKSLHNKTEWVELRHDKLCEYAKKHIEAQITKKKNIRNHSPLKYLTVRGRQIHENSYFISSKLPKHLSFLHFIKGGTLNAPDLNLDFSGILQNSSSAHHCELRMRVMDKEDNRCDTEDGIREISVKIVDGKIYDICFWGEGQRPHKLYFGASGITFYYDNIGRVVLKDYYSLKVTECGSLQKERITLDNGYTSILYMYKDDSECPEKTIYLKLDKCNSVRDYGGNPKQDEFGERMKEYNCKHIDGNSGYISEYDQLGCEIKRIFIDEKGNESLLKYGFSEVRFERYSDETIKSISYYRYGEKYAIDSIFKRTYQYNDDLSHITGEQAFDIDAHLIIHPGGINTSAFIHGKDSVLVTNNEDSDTPCQLIFLSPQSQPECILDYDSRRNLCASVKEFTLYTDNGLVDTIAQIDIIDNRNFKIIKIQKMKYDDKGGDFVESITYDVRKDKISITDSNNDTMTSFSVSRNKGRHIWLFSRSRTDIYITEMRNALQKALEIIQKRFSTLPGYSS